MILSLRAGADVAAPRAMLRISVGALTALSVSACSGAIAEPPRNDLLTEPTATAVMPAPPEKDTKSTDVCEPGTLDVHKDERGLVDRLHARVEALDRSGPFLVDTGTSRTFASRINDDPVYNTPAIIACRSTVIPVFDRGTGTTPSGEAQSGRLGVDLLMRGAYDLDLANGSFTWATVSPPPPSGAIVLPLETRHNWLVASNVVVDGKAVKLLVDTGAHNILLMSKSARAGEHTFKGMDGTGAEVTLFGADGEVSLAGEKPRRLPVDRAETFPTLEKVIEGVGNDVVGLLGLSALGDKRIILSRDALVIVP